MADLDRSSLPSVGVIAKRLCVPVHRVEYVIRSRGILPMGWAGNARVFSESDVQRIAAELRQIDVGGDGRAHNG
ncbi:MAG: hypothetical protein AB7N65_01705 [Vicinamibacterales bacterium]